MSPPSEFTLRTDIYPSIEPSLFKGALKGKVAIVTGSGRGIGREIAFALAKSGASVAITGRTQSEVKRTAEEIISTGTKAIFVVADVCSTVDQERLLKEVSDCRSTLSDAHFSRSKKS